MWAVAPEPNEIVMSDLPAPEITPPGPDVAPTPEPVSPDPAPAPEIQPASTPDEAPAGSPMPDDGRTYD